MSKEKGWVGVTEQEGGRRPQGDAAHLLRDHLLDLRLHVPVHGLGCGDKGKDAISPQNPLCMGYDTATRGSRLGTCTSIYLYTNTVMFQPVGKMWGIPGIWRMA